MTKAKRRSVSQKVGRQGEIIFAGWVNAGHFSANKLDDNFGVDFVCQQMLPAGKSIEEVSGRNVFVQARASSTEKKPRIVWVSRLPCATRGSFAWSECT